MAAHPSSSSTHTPTNSSKQVCLSFPMCYCNTISPDEGSFLSRRGLVSEKARNLGSVCEKSGPAAGGADSLLARRAFL